MSFIPKPLRAHTQPVCHPVQQHKQANSHAKPAEASQNACQPCKYWVNSGGCPKGDSCHYDHPQGDDLIAARQQWVFFRCASTLMLESRSTTFLHSTKDCWICVSLLTLRSHCMALEWSAALTASCGTEICMCHAKCCSMAQSGPVNNSVQNDVPGKVMLQLEEWPVATPPAQSGSVKKYICHDVQENSCCHHCIGRNGQHQSHQVHISMQACLLL